MILKSFRNYLILVILLISQSFVFGEDKIDIWKNDKKKSLENNQSPSDTNKKIEIGNALSINTDTEIKIEEGTNKTSDQANIFGVYDPEDFDFNLNMWSSTKAEDVRASLKRIKKIKLSKTSE